MDTQISRAEHEEFAKRIEDEDRRQNRRIEVLEESVRQFTSLTVSVEKLATNMSDMVKEQERQGARLEQLEGRDGEKWRSLMSYVGTTIIGILIGYIFNLLV